MGSARLRGETWRSPYFWVYFSVHRLGQFPLCMRETMRGANRKCLFNDLVYTRLILNNVTALDVVIKAIRYFLKCKLNKSWSFAGFRFAQLDLIICAIHASSQRITCVPVKWVGGPLLLLSRISLGARILHDPEHLLLSCCCWNFTNTTHDSLKVYSALNIVDQNDVRNFFIRVLPRIIPREWRSNILFWVFVVFRCIESELAITKFEPFCTAILSGNQLLRSLTKQNRQNFAFDSVVVRL